MKFKAKLAAREIAGEVYIVDIAAETLHSLNPAGSCIWNCLKKGLDSGQAADRLAAEFEVEPAEALADVKDFIRTLEQKGLLVK